MTGRRATSGEEELDLRRRPRPWRTLARRAYREYVLGHDRGWEAGRKRRAAEMLEAGGEGEAPGSSHAGEGEKTGRGGESGGAAIPPAPRRRFGVPVPERLDYHRGPDTWRDRILRGSGPAREGERSAPTEDAATGE